MPSLLPEGRGFVAIVRRIFFVLALLYPVLIAIIAAPVSQRFLLFQHALRLPFFARFDMPEKYGLAPGKTMNLHLTTSDNVTLGAWFVLADPYHRQLRNTAWGAPQQPSIEDVEAAVAAHPTILYLHGAAATRAVDWRVRAYEGFTSRLHVNVFSIEYRGFGDSTGVPSEAGLELDAYTGWKWLLDHGAKREDIVILGHSLGTGVAGQLVKRLAAQGEKPRGIVLFAPFSSLSKLIQTYSFFGLPILQPLQNFSFGRKLLTRLVRHEFDTLSAVQHFNAPTLIVHSQDDFQIPHAHSRTLVDMLLEPLLPELPVDLPTAPGIPFDSEQFSAFTKAQNERREVRSALVRKTEIRNFGVLEEFQGHNSPHVVYLETFWGSHSEIGAQEGVHDEMGRVFSLP